MNAIGNLSEYRFFLKKLVSSKADFYTKVGNFSSEIFFKGEKYFFSDSQRDFKIFNAVAMLKKDLKNNLEMFEVDKNELEYFFCNKKNVDRFEYNLERNGAKNWNFCNIDIRNAYPSVLKNTGLLRETTWKAINSLEKKDKLAVCGMLAYEPHYFYYQNGKLCDTAKRKSDFSNCFFYCVKRVEETMREIMQSIPEDFLFSWVDGVFFSIETDEPIKKIKEILDKNNFLFTQELCDSMQLERHEDYFRILYNKNGEKKELTYCNYKRRTEKKFSIINSLIHEENEIEYRKILEQKFVLDENGKILF